MKSYCLILLLLIFSTGLRSQDPDDEYENLLQDLGKEFNEDLKQITSEFDSFYSGINDEYLEFMNESEQEFIKFLKDGFKEMKLEPPEDPESTPKPEIIPELKQMIINQNFTTEKVTEILPEKPQDIYFLPFADEKNADFKYDTTEFDFIGNHIKICYDPTLTSVSTGSSINPESIAAYYTALQQSNYYSLVSELIAIKNRLNLNDWDFLKLALHFTQSITDDVNNQRLLTWFLLLKSNYKIRVGYYNNMVFLLISPEQMIYKIPFLYINRDRYFILDCSYSEIKTYEKEYYNTFRYFDLYHDKPVYFGEQYEDKVLEFKHDGKSHKIHLSLNTNLIDYFSTYPQLSVQYYFSNAVSDRFKETVNQSLLPLLKNLNQHDALHFLLSFIQQSFAYQTDAKQFGYEKYMVPEELVYYNSSDCDDRVIFFSYLVNELLNLNIIALKFDGHICCAAEITDGSMKGNLSFNGKEYVMCDPTYLNAPPGLIIPGYDPQEAEVLDFNSYLNQYRLSKKIWQKLNSAGGYQADLGNNLAISAEGQVFVTGSYRQRIDIDGNTLTSNDDNAHAFIACFNQKGTLNWIKDFKGTSINYGYCLSISDNNNIYMFGYFQGMMEFDNSKYESDSAGAFLLACCDKNGLPQWLRSLKLPDESGDIDAIIAKLDQDGNLVYYEKETESDYDFNYQLGVDDHENCYIWARVTETLKKNYIGVQFSKGGEFDIIEYLVSQNNSLRDNNYHQSVSFLYSLINLISSAGYGISGNTVQKAIEKVNSKYSDESPSIYNNLGRIKQVDNLHGIVMMKTIDKKPVFFNQLMAENNSRIRLNYQNNNAKVEVLNGLKIGNQYKWSDINTITLDKSSGEIIFDYDNHYRKKMPVHSEVL